MYVLFQIVTTGWEKVFNHLKQWFQEHKIIWDGLRSKQMNAARSSLDFLNSILFCWVGF